MEYAAPHLTLAKSYWRSHLKPGDIVIDATCGNGNDTLFLSQHVLSDPESAVFAFDIQPEAIQNTESLLKQRLSADHFRRVLLHRRSHLELSAVPYPFSPRLVVYNLGYLPGGNKAITTRTEATLESIKMSLQLIADDGALSITCYPGHAEGEKEENELLLFAKSLPSQSWVVCYHTWLNRPKSPTLLWIEQRKLKEKSS